LFKPISKFSGWDMHVLFGGEKFENKKFTTNYDHILCSFKNQRMRCVEPGPMIGGLEE